jgi:subtilisin family serine protease
MKRFAVRLTGLCALLIASPLLAQDLGQPYAEGQVLVRFGPGLAAADRAAVRGALLPTASQEIPLVPGLELVQTPLDVTQAIAVLTNNPNVEFIEPDYIVQAEALPNDTYFPLEWGLHNTGQSISTVYGIVDADIDMPEAWAVASQAAGTLVAVIDTGTQLDHPDLAASIWTNDDEIPDNGIDDDGNGFVDDVHGWDFYSSDNDPGDEHGHGTHTAGTIAATTGNGIGIAGICDSCAIMPLRFLGPAGGRTSDAILALQYAVANGATVSNNSWGGGGYSQAMADAIAQAGLAGHVFVASAGNSSLDTDVTPHYPSSYTASNLISVAATTNQDLLASFSNFGATSVDIGAPGHNIASLYKDNGYYYMSGTSMAAPHVTGVVALLQANAPGLSVAEVVGRILGSARPVPALAATTLSGGMLNAYDALNGSGGSEPPDSPPELLPPDSPPEQFSAEDQGDGTALLSWSKVDGATYYIIERQEKKTKGRNAGTWTGATSFTVQASGSGSSMSHVDNPGANELHYRIAAANEAGTSPSFSDWAPVTVTDGSSDSGGSGGGSTRCHPKKGC